MQQKTSARIRACTTKEFLPGNTIRYATDAELKYWNSKGWIKKVGEMYILTEKGWRAA